MMTEEEVKEIIKGLNTSPDFIRALQSYHENSSTEGEDLHKIALWFFSQGYLSRLDYEKTKKMTRPYKYNQGHQGGE